MNRLFNPQNRKLSGFFRWFHFFIFSNKCCGEASCCSGGNCVSEGHGIRSFESSRFIHNRVRNGFNNAYGLSKNGFDPYTRSIFSGNIKPVIVYLKQLNNTHVKANSTGSGLLKQVEDNSRPRFAVKNSQQCTGIKEIKHFLRLPHTLKLGVFFCFVRPFPRKICVHCIQPFIYPSKRSQGSCGFLLWHGFRSNGKFNFRFSCRQFRRYFKGNLVAGGYFNRLFESHTASVA